MNSLGRKILKILETTPVQGMSIHILSKQSIDAGFSFETISHDNIQHLVENLENVLPFFMPYEVASDTLEKIKEFQNTGD